MTLPKLHRDGDKYPNEDEKWQLSEFEGKYGSWEDSQVPKWDIPGTGKQQLLEASVNHST